MKLLEQFDLKTIQAAKLSMIEDNEIEFCNVCGTKETPQWYSDPLDHGMLCQAHYRRLRYILNKDDEKAEAKAYYKDNKEDVIERVMRNKRKIKEVDKKTAIANRTCNNCHSDTTYYNKTRGIYVWSVDKWTGRKGHVCNKCADKLKHAMNPDKKNAAKRKAHNDNKGGIAERSRTSNQERREANPEARSEYYAANKDKERETHKAWRTKTSETSE